jgi:hypothetical protein
MIARHRITKLHLPIAAVFLTLAAPDASGQTRSTPGSTKPPDPQAEIVRLLQSKDPVEQAWGAWFAGRDNVRQLAPDVQRVVLRSPGDAPFTTRVALDALIQLQASVSSDFLSNVYPDHPMPALILASHSGEGADAFLLDVVRQATDLPWFAAANLLLSRSHTTPRLGDAIFRDLKLTVAVYIVQSGSRYSGAAGGMGIGCGGIGFAPGFPPLADYRLTPFARPGDVVLSDGPKPIYYTRVLSQAGLTPAPSSLSIGGPTADDRLSYLARLAGMAPEELSIRGDESHSIQAKSGVDPKADIDRIRADVQRRMARLVEHLVRLGVLTESAATRQTPIEIRIEDLRSDVEHDQD